MFSKASYVRHSGLINRFGCDKSRATEVPLNEVKIIRRPANQPPL